MTNGTSDSMQQGFISILIADVIASKERHRTSDSQQSRRDLIRSVFAAVEGLVWTYREHIVSAAREIEIISYEEELALSEVSYRVTEQGKVIEQTRFIAMPAIIRLTTRIALRLDSSLDIRFDSVGWNQLRRSIEIRNRITHPKSEADLLIDESDISACLAGFFWLIDVAARAMAAANAALNQYFEGLCEVFDDLKAGDPETWKLYRSLQQRSDEL